MSTWRVNNSTALGGEVCSPWQANHAYGLGARVVCRIAYGTTARRAYVYECTTAGTSHGSTEPTWPTSGTVNDNDVVWTTRSPNDGSWDNASCYLYYITNHAAADGDTIYIDDGHSEAGVGAAMTINMSTTASNPLRVYCVDKASDALSTGATVATGNQNLILNGSVYCYGVHYNSGTGNITFSYAAGVYCIWTLEGNNTTVLTCHGTSGITSRTDGYTTNLLLINANISLKYVFALTDFGLVSWRGGAIVDGGFTDGSKLFRSVGKHANIVIEDVDLSAFGNGATSMYLYTASGVQGVNINFIRCKLPTDAGVGIATGLAYRESGKVTLHHCSSSNKYYDFYEASYEGVVEDETTIVRTGGASDGTNGLAFKMVSSSACIENIVTLKSPAIHSWTDSTTEKTFTVEGVWDSATNIQNDEIWMELEYPANNTDGLGAIAKDKCAILGTPADQAASTETWTGTGGFSNENKFKLSVTVTPGKAGPITARIYLGKASTTVYIDPKITEN